ncbi:ABC transporter ATP-binding protein [Psychrobacter pygoscelis]|uniref:ABC transporter ATP-binding protein n=1 Tax=Psychrobacter pygoscelis TaxID=2488563 RepID=UPI0013F48EF3|nr:ABC transporter ATP-binding protein [Psychrobacter pygoscelis]
MPACSIVGKNTVSEDKTLFALNDVRIATTSKILVQVEQLMIPSQSLVAFIGPNGAGKSTLLHAILNQHIGSGLTVAGTITAAMPVQIENGDPNALHNSQWVSSEQLIRRGKIAWVGQHERFELPLTALEYALLGVSPVLSWYQRPNQYHLEKAQNLLHDFELTALSTARVQTLSGGEKQRLAIVRALMQDTEILMFDEPTNHLDIRHQRFLLRYLKRLVEESGKSIVVVLHDLTHAYRYSDEVVLIDQGQIVAQGSPSMVMTHQQLSKVYQTDINAYDTEGGRVFM